CNYGSGPTADLIFTICNRGNAPAVGPFWAASINAPAGTPPHNGGTAAAPTCYSTPVANYTCRYDGTLAAGACVNLPKNSALGAGCAGNFGNGNILMMVNGPNAPALITECDLDVKDTVNAVQPTQPGCANNLTSFNTNTLPSCGGFAQVTFSQ